MQDKDGKPYRTAGIAVDITSRKKAEARVAYLNRVYAMLGGINTLIVRAGDRDSLFRDACQIAVKEGEFLMCWLGMIDQELGEIVLVASAGMDEEFLSGLRVRLSSRSAGAFSKTGL